jgi:general secretion pathway protein G
MVFMKTSGFTLVEVLMVVALIGVLTAIMIPNFSRAAVRAREAVLKENLFMMRDAIQKYYLDKKKYPSALEDLVSAKYLRQIPFDPFSKTNEWDLLYFEADEYADYDPDVALGIIDVKSKSHAKALDGSLYHEW